MGNAGRRIVIVDGVRTPFLKAGSIARALPAYELGRQALNALMARREPGRIDEVVLGCVGNPPEAANVARVTMLRAGLDEAIPARTVSRNCASGMESITSAAEKILAGRSEVAIAGGIESMSQAPVMWPVEFGFWLEEFSRARSLAAKARALWRFRRAYLKPRIGILEGLSDPVCELNMGQTAEIVARDFGITREEQDRFALESHRRAQAATASGRFAREITPLFVPPTYDAVTADNGIRNGQSMEALAKLKPVFDRTWGTVTAGNSSQLTDGACALLVTTAEYAAARGWEPLGTLRAWAYMGLAPQRMGLGPVFASARLFAEEKIALKDLDLIEINEAFAAQVLGCARAFESAAFARTHHFGDAALGTLDFAKVNVNGGAIALGHPVGVSGARLVLTLLTEMKERNLGLGLATLCVGGGQGAALLLERS